MHEEKETRKRKLRILVVTMGGERKEVLEQLIQSNFKEEIELGFVGGVNGASLIRRGKGWNKDGGDACDRAGIDASEFKKRAKKLRDSDGRVLGAAIAHLRAMAVAIDEGYDLIVEDNIRFCNDAPQIIRDILEEYQKEDLVYFGYMIYHDTLAHLHGLSNLSSTVCCEDIKADCKSLEEQKRITELRSKALPDEYRKGKYTMIAPQPVKNGKLVDVVWGMFAYKISQEAFKYLVKILNDDPGKLFWERRRGKPEIRPLDRVLPRLIKLKSNFLLSRKPCTFRMPPGHLESTIHSKFDIKYFESTTLQLKLIGRCWDDISLTEKEKNSVSALLDTSNEIGRNIQKILEVYASSNPKIQFDEEMRLQIFNMGLDGKKVQQKGAANKDQSEMKSSGTNVSSQEIPIQEMRTPKSLDDIKDLITVLVTTSPVPSCPSTSLIEVTLTSLIQYAPPLIKAPMIVVCDGAKVTETNNYRRGRVTDDMSKAYEGYKNRLEQLSKANMGVWENSKIIQLSSRHGFGFAVREGLRQVSTPFVLVLQHDRVFMREFNLLGAIKALAFEKSVNYILLQNTSTLGYLKKLGDLLNKGKHKVQIPSQIQQLVVADVPLTPLVQWLDSTHICKTEWYRSFVFDPARKLVSRGGFIEDKFGQAQIADIRSRGFQRVYEWGCWLLDDKQERCVGHVNGRRAISAAQKQAMIDFCRSNPSESLQSNAALRWQAAMEVKESEKEHIYIKRSISAVTSLQPKVDDDVEKG